MSTDKFKMVRTFQINSVPWRVQGAYLMCGNWIPSKGTGWGYRKIKAKHGQDWANLANLVGANWRDMADFGISETLKTIYHSTIDTKKNTTAFRGVIQLKKYDGKTIRTYYPNVTIDSGDGRIITAFPQSRK